MFTLQPGLFLAITLLCCRFAAAQSLQWQPTHGPLGGTVHCFATIDSTVYAEVYASGVFQSTDHGASWRNCSNGLDGPTVYAFAVLGDTLFAAVGNGVQRLNGDSTWSFVNGGIVDTISMSSLVVCGSTIIAGASYRGTGVYVSTNAGFTWSHPPNAGLPTTQNRFLPVVSIDAMTSIGNTVFAGTDSGLFRSSNFGDSWIHVDTLRINGTGGTLAVFGSTIFAASERGGLSHSIDSGTTWIVSTFKFGGVIAALTMVDSIMYAGTIGRGVCRSLDSGLTWTQVNSGFTSSAVYSFGAMGTTLFAGTYCYGVYTSTNAGDTWSSANAGIQGTQVNALAADDSTVYAGTGFGVFRMPVNVEGWTQENQGLGNIHIMELCVEGGTMIAATPYDSYDGGGVYTSTNHGDQWSDITSGQAHANTGPLLCNGSEFFAGTLAGLFRTTNQGATWTKQINGLTDSIVLNLARRGSTLFAGTESGVFRSIDDGDHWQAVNNGLDQPHVYALAVAGSSIFLAGSHYVYRSTNDGDLWTRADSGISDPAVSAFATAGNTLFAAAYDGVYFTTNNGDLWKTMNTGLPASYVNALVACGNTLFAGLSYDGVYRADISSITAVAEHTIPQTPILSLNASPNPASNELRVQYNAANSNAEISLCNVLGERVMFVGKQSNEGGHAEFDIAVLPVGMYSLTLRSGNAAVSRLVMVVR